MANFLITGGAGYFGSILKTSLLNEGHHCVSIDIQHDENTHEDLFSVQGDIRNSDLVSKVFDQYGPFDAVFHIAALLGHAVREKKFLWESNVDGTEVVVSAAIKHKIPKLVYTSSNTLYGHPLNRKITETDEPQPVCLYGRSKWEGEKILLKYAGQIDSVIFRVPTITSAGRLGLLAILFDFISENRRVYVVGGGENRYQFIYADDLVQACIASLKLSGTEIFGIGSDNVKPFNEVYQYVIDKSGSTSKVVSLPKSPTLLAMKASYALGLSPLGPYQYKMISESFEFDTSKAKAFLKWAPTKTNEEMLLEAYNFYFQNKAAIKAKTSGPAHKLAANMGIISLLKWLS